MVFPFPEFLSILAILASVSANIIAERARRTAARAEVRNVAIVKAEKRTEMLVEIELKNAAVGNVLLVVAKKILLFQKKPHLYLKHPTEYERLQTVLELMQSFKDEEAHQRQLSEESPLTDFELHGRTLADIRRLRVRLEDEAKKEEKEFSELVRELENEA